MGALDMGLVKIDLTKASINFHQRSSLKFQCFQLILCTDKLIAYSNSVKKLKFPAQCQN